MKEFEKYKVCEKSHKKNWIDPCRIPLRKINHVTHIDMFFNIIESSILQPQLVYDDSILNKSRILINWLSPNDWQSGYRYGNVKLEFDFDKIIDGMNYYWVEIKQYKIPACRILITDKDHSDLLQKYDPVNDSGPWLYDQNTKQHYFNSTICLEFMVERSSLFDEILNCSIVDHHRDWCSKFSNDPKKCKDLGRNNYSASERIISGLLMVNKNYNTISKFKINLDNYMKNFLELFLCRINQANYKGLLDENSDLSMIILKSIINSIYRDEKKDGFKMLELYKSATAIETVFREYIKKKMNITDSEINYISNNCK